MIRLHLNENPIVKQRFHLYPDANYEELRGLLRKQLRLDSSEVLVGNGSTELLSVIFLWAHLNKKKIVIPWPSYILYKELADLFNIDVIWVAVDIISWDLDKIATAVPENAVLILCNPNNPTGTYIQKDHTKQLIAKLPSSATIVIDEAYIEYVDDSEETIGLLQEVERNPQCIVVRTFSKYYGLAGLRIGYAVLSLNYYAIFRAYLQLWNVCVPAVESAIDCLNNQERYLEGKRQTIALRNQLQDNLVQSGFHVLPSQTNFLCITHPRIDFLEVSWRKAGFIVNSLQPYINTNLKGYIRLSIGLPEVMDKFVEFTRGISRI